MNTDLQKESSNGLAVITGASSGIGRCISVELARQGFTLGVDHFRDPAGAERTLRLAKEAREESGRSPCEDWICDADVGSSEELDRLFSQVGDRDQTLEVFINNAAVQTFAPLLELREEDWDRTIRTNLKGCFLCTQKAATLMREQGQGGNIINIGSGANQVPFPSLGDYCASKGGIEMLTKVASVELGPLGIRVNCIAPGAIENERTKEENPKYGELWGGLAPIRRVGTEQDIANLVAFLVSDRSSFITGQTIFADGGLWTKNEWPYEG